MIKSKQRMDFNMTSNNQRNIPPKKRTRSLLKPQNPSLPRLRGLLRPKKQTPGLLQNPIAAGPIWTISGKHKTATINTRAVDMPVNCQKKSGKEIHRDGGSRNRSPPADDRRRMCTVGGTAGKHFRAASICSAAGGGLQPHVGMCKAFGQGISASGIRLSADSVQNFAARRSLHHGGRSVRHRRTC